MTARRTQLSVTRWFVLAIVALILGLGMAFLAIGTAHRDSCALTTSNFSGCTLVPWSGHLSSGDLLGP